MNEFSDRYKNFSNTDLIRILENSADYQPLAVEAARKEIVLRQLSEEEIKQAGLALAAEDTERAKKIGNRKEAEDQIKKAAQSFSNIINPSMPDSSSERTIRILCLVFGGLFLFQIITEYGILRIMIEDIGDCDLSCLYFFLPYALIPSATFIFWRRKKIGWILLSVFLTYTAVGALIMFFIDINSSSSGLAALDSLFPSSSPIFYLGSFVIYAGCLWAICKEDIRRIYKINIQTILVTIGLTSMFTALLTTGLF